MYVLSTDSILIEINHLLEFNHISMLSLTELFNVIVVKLYLCTFISYFKLFDVLFMEFLIYF
jgi:hypothetical protein